MAVSEVTGGSQLAVLGTDHTLTTQTTAGVYVLVVDLSVLTDGDWVELAMFAKSRSGESSKQAFRKTFANAQADALAYSIPVPVNVEVVAKLKQPNISPNVARTFTWALLTL